MLCTFASLPFYAYLRKRVLEYTRPGRKHNGLLYATTIGVATAGISTTYGRSPALQSMLHNAGQVSGTMANTAGSVKKFADVCISLIRIFKPDFLPDYYPGDQANIHVVVHNR